MAKVVGKILEDHGAEVDVVSMQEVKELAPYQAVVAGSAIQDKQWLPEAVDFSSPFGAIIDVF